MVSMVGAMAATKETQRSSDIVRGFILQGWEGKTFQTKAVGEPRGGGVGSDKCHQNIESIKPPQEK